MEKEFALTGTACLDSNFALKFILVALLTVFCSGFFQGQGQVFSYGDTVGGFGEQPSGDLLALNHFNTVGSSAWITEIGVLWSPLSASVHPTVVLYSDPNGDGNPSDMQPLLIQPISIPPHVIILGNAGVQFYSIPPTEVNDSFFVGAYLSDQDNASPGIAFDIANSGPGQSWVIETSRAGELDLQNPIGTAADWENLDTFTIGNHIINAIYTNSMPEPQFSYTSSDGAITITGYTGPGGSITIPNQIHGLPVTSVGGDAFYQSTSLTSIVISGGVTNIGYGAFYGCSNLTSIIIPNSVVTVADGAFGACIALTNVAIPDSVISLGTFAFDHCVSLASVTLPSAMTGVPEGTFEFCTSLSSVTLPSSVTSIGDAGFLNCSSLTNITLPSGLTEIGASALGGCSGLSSLVIPEHVASVGSYAFSGCLGLESISIPASLTNIANDAFQYCTSLTSITVDSLNPAYSSVDGVLFDKNQATLLCYPPGKSGPYTVPGSVAIIANGAFEYCNKLTSVTISGSVASIADSAFQDCSGLVNVITGGSVRTIGPSAFQGCFALANLTINDGVTNIGAWAFAACSNLTHVQLPHSLTDIGAFAFRDCYELLSVAIPDTVSVIESGAFYECRKLAAVYFMGDAPSLLNAVFNFDRVAVVYHGSAGPARHFGRKRPSVWRTPWTVWASATWAG